MHHVAPGDASAQGANGRKGSVATSAAARLLGISADDARAASRIRVVVRKRPLSRKEKARNDVDVVEIADERVFLHEPRTKVDLTRYVETHDFRFDDAFDEKTSNETVYFETCKHLVASIFDGAKATCFAYGQTGSGKTHTMMGPDTSRRAGKRKKHVPGMYELAAADIFRLARSPAYEHLSVHVSFFEIYGGRLFDLLNERRRLRCLEDHNKQSQIVGLRQQLVSDPSDLFGLIDQGHAARSTGTTGANVDSSRSHAVLQIKLVDTRTGRPTGGKFSFIDLAGSERGADTTHNNRQTRMEGAEINKSLLALKECIRALFHVQDHTPFRGSKLTQVLKDSFVGNSLTVMVVTISPNLTNAEHTLNTLRYGYRVKEIKQDGGPRRGGAGLDLNRDYGSKGRSKSSKSSIVRKSAPGLLAHGKRRNHQMQHNVPSSRPSTSHGSSSNARRSSGSRQAADARKNLTRSISRKAKARAAKRSSVVRDVRMRSRQRSSGTTRRSLDGPPPAPQAAATSERMAPPDALTPNPGATLDGGESTPSPMMGGPPEPMQWAGSTADEPQSGSGSGGGTDTVSDSPLSQDSPAMVDDDSPASRALERPSLSPLLNPRDDNGDTSVMTELDLAGSPAAPSLESLSPEKMQEEHADLVSAILTDEEDLVTCHREQIHEMMNLVKQEMAALDEIETPGANLDAYVNTLDAILLKKANLVRDLRTRLNDFRSKLQAEEELSASIGSSRQSSPNQDARHRKHVS